MSSRILALGSREELKQRVGDAYHGNNISSLIHTLEHGKEDLGVEFYNVGKAALDEIFEKIVQQHEDQSQ
ncbi:hypothetical protein BS50DRAFT_633460 [Corynespora cassiicola Philippines]|uniref:Uncharacterized protein n=1 Tax=Corynespora cassiicola Philippines TaxID=1448308 RepID=A0A2T2NQT5_CORCC|nr:hypothetical protein BS50DRAFT_633460 [Corynespora cassiicola Philippines]